MVVPSVRRGRTPVRLDPLMYRPSCTDSTNLGFLLGAPLVEGNGVVDAVELHGRHRTGRVDSGDLHLPRDRGDSGDVIRCLGRHGVGHHAAVGDARHVDAPEVDRRAGRHVGDDLFQEADIIDLLGHRQAATLAGVPAVLRVLRHRVRRQHLGDAVCRRDRQPDSRSRRHWDPSAR